MANGAWFNIVILFICLVNGITSFKLKNHCDDMTRFIHKWMHFWLELTMRKMFKIKKKRFFIIISCYYCLTSENPNFLFVVAIKCIPQTTVGSAIMAECQSGGVSTQMTHIILIFIHYTYMKNVVNSFYGTFLVLGAFNDLHCTLYI